MSILRLAAVMLVGLIATVSHADAQDSPIVSFVETRLDEVAQPMAIARTPRGVMLPSLYASFGALEAFDGCTTLVGIARGVREANPVTAGLSGHPAALVAFKAGMTMVAISSADHLWREDRRKAAVIVMLLSNGIAAAVAAHNAAALRQRR
jgi:hypothetical protein